jgi:cytochrome c553
VPDTLAQRALPCTSCHQAEDRQTAADGYIPRIAGKPAGYLLAQLRAFRDGRRSHIGMAHLLAPLDDAYLAELAGHFAALPSAPYRPPATPLDPDSERRASAWILRGDAARGVPACTACHGDRLTGVAPAVPGLLGLPAAYVSAQLGAWRQGLRRAQQPDCMAQIAQALPLEDVPAIARWLAVRPLPADPRPAPAPALTSPRPGPWPLPCGSIPP